MKNKVAFVILIALVLALGIFAAANAQGETQDLQPYYRLMNGDEELGVVYALDYGWLILTEEDTIYTCGCNEGVCYETEGFEVVVPTEAPTNSSTLVPPSEEPTSVPTLIPTAEPTQPVVPTATQVVEPTDKPKCNSGRGNNSEGNPDCDPGNSGGHNQGGD